jgi:hypothetical protein
MYEDTMEAEQLVRHRQVTHGPFRVHAQCKQSLKSAFKHHQRKGLDAVKRTALDMIFEKISRIAAGDPSFIDHWEDIAGYATLAAQDIREGGEEKDANPNVR